MWNLKMVPTIYWWQVYCTEIEFHLDMAYQKDKVGTGRQAYRGTTWTKKTQNKDTIIQYLNKLKTNISTN